MSKSNDEFLAVYEELLPLVQKSRSQNMHTLLASCVNSELDDAARDKITTCLREQLELHKGGKID